MTILSNLSKVDKAKSKRIGRGPGSGKGKTTGRGTKGQNARGKLPITHSHYEGGQRPLFKRLPYRRGKGNGKVSAKPLVVNFDDLPKLPQGTIINIETLVKMKVVDEKEAKQKGVKILGFKPAPGSPKIDLPTYKKNN